MLKAFWLGELRLLQPGGTVAASRRTFLLGLHALPDWGAIAFVRSPFDLPPDVTSEPDGSIAVDFTRFVILPDPLAPTPEQLETAYRTLAGIPVRDYPDSFLEIVRCHLIARTDFAHFCDIRGSPRPSFWFRTRRARTTTAERQQAIDNCRKWLPAIFAGPRRSKETLREEGKRRFRGLRDKDFDALWAELAPGRWRQPGAIARKDRRGDGANPSER